MITPRLHDGLRFVATRTAISCSRVFVAYTLDKWGTGVIVGDAVLVVDELVTNAVKATGTMDERPELTNVNFITVRLLGMENSIRLEVWDSDPELPALPEEAGQVLKHGCYSTAGGKVVWAELPLLPRRSGPVAPIHLPLPEERGRHQTEPDLLRRVRDGLDEL